MGKFAGNVLLERSEVACKEFKVVSLIKYFADDGKIYTIEPGWITDGASFPSRLNGCPFAGCYLEGALLHDMLYASQLITRKEADNLFLEAMGAKDVGFYTRWKMYYAVRAGGWSVWRKSTKEKREYYSCFITIKEKDVA